LPTHSHENIPNTIQNDCPQNGLHIERYCSANGAAFAEEAITGVNPDFTAFAVETHGIVQRHLGSLAQPSFRLSWHFISMDFLNYETCYLSFSIGEANYAWLLCFSLLKVGG
jgi:hypothetical protein